MKKKYKAFISSIILVLVLTSIPLYAVDQPFNCPKSRMVRVYEPCQWDTHGEIHNALKDQLSDVNDQGYSFFYIHDDNYNSSCSPCIRPVFNYMGSSAGILVFDGHGATEPNTSINCFCAAYSTDLNDCIDWVVWDTNEDLGNGMEIGSDPNNGGYICLVEPLKLGNMFQANMSANDGIVVLSFCNSAQALSYLHGDIGFGYDCNRPNLLAITDIKYTFGTMNGTFLGSSFNLREAGTAYNLLSTIPNYGFICQTGSGYEGITLCPTIENTYIYPDDIPICINEGETAGLSGWGYILFDSHCDATITAASLIDYYDPSPGSGFTLTDVYWATEEGYEDIALCFDYCAASEYDVYIYAGAYAPAGQASDGGDSIEKGVAPNNDYYVFPLSD